VPRKAGALESVLAALGAAFRGGGDQLVLALAGEPGPGAAALFRAGGAEWRVMPGWTDADGREHPWRFCAPALRLLRAERPDVAAVHFGNELPSLVASLAAPLTGARGVRWIWQQDQQMADPSRVTRVVSRLRALCATFDHFVAVSDAGRRSMVLRGIPAARITVIRNGTPDRPRTRERGWLRRELGVPGGTLLAVTIGSLIPRKRIDFQIRALAEAARAAPVHLAVAGDGPDRPALEQLARDLGVAARVSFLGLRQDVAEILHEADIVTHSSVAEGSAYALAEAMAAGVPAIVTAAGAAREQVEDGRSGVVLGRDDAAGFAAAISALARDPAERVRMGREARLRWEREYRAEVAAARYHELYRRVAGR
jgi:glycosyltransferase involved in cell wall biosynthesis